jgi:hypothetical protein
MSVFDSHGFLTFTNKAVTISGVEGWKKLSIFVDSASSSGAAITSSNTKTIGGNAQNGITINAGESITIGSGDRDVDGVTITAPSGCTVSLLAVTNQPIIGG